MPRPHAVSLLLSAPWTVAAGKLPVKLIDPDLHSTTDGCDAAKIKAAGPFNNTVVIVQEGPGLVGNCYRDDQLTNIYNNGGNYVLFFARPAPYDNPFVTAFNDGQQAGGLQRADGLYIKQQINAGNKVQIDFSRQALSSIPDTQNGGYMNLWSTYGPNWDLRALDVSAPGGNVLAAVPLCECNDAQHPGPRR